MRRQKKESVDNFYINTNLMFKYIQAYKSNVKRAKQKNKNINTDQQSTPHFQFDFLFSGPPVSYRLQSTSSIRPNVVIFRAKTSLALFHIPSLNFLCFSFRPKFGETVAGHHTRNDKFVSLLCVLFHLFVATSLELTPWGENIYVCMQK